MTERVLVSSEYTFSLTFYYLHPITFTEWPANSTGTPDTNKWSRLQRGDATNIGIGAVTEVDPNVEDVYYMPSFAIVLESNGGYRCYTRMRTLINIVYCQQNDKL